MVAAFHATSPVVDAYELCKGEFAPRLYVPLDDGDLRWMSEIQLTAALAVVRGQQDSLRDKA